MKRILMFLCLLLVVSACKTKKKSTSGTVTTPVTKERIAIEDANPEQKKRAYEFGKRVLNTCNTSRFKPFTSSEATPEVLRNTTEARLTKTCHAFRLKYGTFKDLTLVEIIPNKKEKTNLYRYRAHYSKPVANKELRVTMTEDNKLAGLKSVDWQEDYQP